MKFMMLLILLTSCRFPPQGGSLQFEEVNFTQSAEALNFAKVKVDILQPFCLQCHPSYNDYQTVKDQLKDIIASVEANRMPKGGTSLAPALKSLLLQWQQAGAPVDAPLPAPVELAPNWNSLAKNVFFPKCVQCHNPQGEAKFLDLSTYEALEANKDDLLGGLENGEHSYLVEVISDPDDPMPPNWTSIEPVSSEELSAIIKWINLKIPRN